MKYFHDVVAFVVVVVFLILAVIFTPINDNSLVGLDSNSKKSPVTVSSENDILFYYNEQDSNKNIVLPSGNYVDVTNKPYSGSLALAS